MASMPGGCGLLSRVILLLESQIPQQGIWMGSVIGSFPGVKCKGGSEWTHKRASVGPGAEDELAQFTCILSFSF